MTDENGNNNAFYPSEDGNNDEMLNNNSFDSQPTEEYIPPVQEVLPEEYLECQPWDGHGVMEAVPEAEGAGDSTKRRKKVLTIVLCCILGVLLVVGSSAFVLHNFYPDTWYSWFGTTDVETEAESETESITERETETETETVPEAEPETEAPTEAPTEPPAEQGGSNTGGTTSKKQGSNNNGGSNNGGGNAGGSAQSTAPEPTPEPEPEPEPEPAAPTLNPDTIVSSAISRVQGLGITRDSSLTTSNASWSGIYTSNYSNPTNDYIVNQIANNYSYEISAWGGAVSSFNISYSKDGSGYVFYLMIG